MTGGGLSSASVRRCWRSSRPFITGIMRSRSITFGDAPERSLSRACWPWIAVSTANPSSSRISATEERTSASSSTSSTDGRDPSSMGACRCHGPGTNASIAAAARSPGGSTLARPAIGLHTAGQVERDESAAASTAARPRDQLQAVFGGATLFTARTSRNPSGSAEQLQRRNRQGGGRRADGPLTVGREVGRVLEGRREALRLRLGELLRLRRADPEEHGRHPGMPVLAEVLGAHLPLERDHVLVSQGPPQDRREPRGQGLVVEGGAGRPP